MPTIDVAFNNNIITEFKFPSENLITLHVNLPELFEDVHHPVEHPVEPPVQPPVQPLAEGSSTGGPIIDHADDADDSGDWTRYKDEESGYAYWYNSKTNQSEWDWKNPTFGGGKKYKTVVKKTSKKIRKRRSKRTTKKLRK